MTDNPLIDAARLRTLLDAEPAAVVLDVRWRLGGPSGHREYAQGHVPGAIFLDLDTDICGPPGSGGRHPPPDPDHLQAVLRRVGVRTDSRVAVYDGGDGMAAARTWWTLRWAGLRDVLVLDGGYPAWPGPTTTDVPAPEPGDLVVRPGGMPVIDAVGAAELGRHGRLVDVRTPERYRGESEPIDPVAGHIPGAVNLPGTETSGGRFEPAAELAQRYAKLPTEHPVGVYCGSGVTAARTVLGMTVAGLRPVLYVGSWSGWITDPERPVATGPEGG